MPLFQTVDPLHTSLCSIGIIPLNQTVGPLHTSLYSISIIPLHQTVGHLHTSLYSIGIIPLFQTVGPQVCTPWGRSHESSRRLPEKNPSIVNDRVKYDLWL